MTYPSYARRRRGGRSPSFPSALTESEDFTELRENGKYNDLLGNCFKKNKNTTKTSRTSNLTSVSYSFSIHPFRNLSNAFFCSNAFEFLFVV